LRAIQAQSTTARANHSTARLLAILLAIGKSLAATFAKTPGTKGAQSEELRTYQQIVVYAAVWGATRHRQLHTAVVV
jgi:hypothetical protein